MSRINRASQFAPFDALKGLSEALRLKEYEHERIIKNDISEEKIMEISGILSNLNKGDKVEVVYYSDGYIKTISGIAKVDIAYGYITISDIKIEFDNIMELKKI